MRRKTFSAEEKMAIVLTFSLKGEESVAEICRHY